eukprot:scaffold58990_cov22-Tisochrysis_lutea.AAC.4
MRTARVGRVVERGAHRVRGYRHWLLWPVGPWPAQLDSVPLDELAPSEECESEPVALLGAAPRVEPQLQLRRARPRALLYVQAVGERAAGARRAPLRLSGCRLVRVRRLKRRLLRQLGRRRARPRIQPG